MQKRKFLNLYIALFVSVFMTFSTGQVKAGPTSCTATNSAGQTITVDIVDDPVLGFPMYFADNNADTQNYCGNIDINNYPCTVFKYKSVGYFNAQQLYATIPYCPDEQLQILNYGSYPLCNAPGNRFSDQYACSMKGIFIPNGGGSGNGTEHVTWIAVKTPLGMTVGLGVNSIVIADNGNPTNYYSCRSNDPESFSGIVGPGCYTTTANCEPPVYTSQTTNVCLPNVNGKVVKLDVEGSAIQAVYECPTTDKSCMKAVCNPNDPSSPCDPAANCVKQETYEVEVAFYDGVTGAPLIGDHSFQVKDVGGTVEEAVGYFVVSEGDPTIYCLSGVGGNTICVCSGLNCPQQ